MKQFYLLTVALASALFVNAQNDTLIWEDFTDLENYNNEYSYTTANNTFVWDYPSSGSGDDKWYSVDLDGYTPNNTSQGSAWFPAIGFSFNDENYHGVVMAATSWFNPLNDADNWLITKSFYCSSDAVLSWYSAPFQTPKYLDGYKVKVSITDNDPVSFTETIFVAKEYDGIAANTDSCVFANYTFAPAGTGFIHGLSGTDVVDNPTDCQRDTGALTMHTVNLSQFGGKRIYIAFVHDSHDDNLISIDDILVKGTYIDDAGINEAQVFTFEAYPNPTTDRLALKYALTKSSDVTVKVLDNTGRTIKLFQYANQNGHNNLMLDMSDISAGVYHVTLETATGKSTKKIIKK